MAPKKPNEEDMELELIQKDLSETKELVRDIKVLLIGNERLKTEGIIQDFEGFKGALRDVTLALDNITAKVLHIFKWREKYLAGEIERKRALEDRRQKETEKFRWTWGNAWTAIATVISIVLALKQLHVF